MKTYFLSDIHGNLPALEKAIKPITNDDRIIILGDIVNYGPWSNECLELINNFTNKECLLGNHEKYFINGFYPKEGIVNDFFNICYEDFRYKHIIERYKNNLNFNEFICQHTIENKYIFNDTNIKINKNYIIGHSHDQYVRQYKKFKIINPGSVGQNRKNIDIISYCYFDHLKKDFQFVNLEYDSNVVIKKMKLLKYPQRCVNYYETKKNK